MKGSVDLKRNTAVILTSVLLCTLLLTSCGIDSATPVIEKDTVLAEKYTETVFTADDMQFGSDDFIFIVYNDSANDFSPEDNSLICLSPSSSVTCNSSGCKNNGFTLITSGMLVPGLSTVDSFTSSYKIADGFSLELRRDMLSSQSDAYIPVTDKTDDSMTSSGYILTIGAYAEGDTWNPMSTASLASVLGFEYPATPEKAAAADDTVLIISACVDEDDLITRMYVYRGTCAELTALRNSGYADIASFADGAEADAKAAEEASGTAGETVSGTGEDIETAAGGTTAAAPVESTTESPKTLTL